MNDGKIRRIEFREVVNESLVANLESALEDARAGRLRSAHVVGTNSDGTIVSWTSQTENILLELASVERLRHRLNAMCDESRDQAP